MYHKKLKLFGSPLLTHYTRHRINKKEFKECAKNGGFSLSGSQITNREGMASCKIISIYSVNHTSNIAIYPYVTGSMKTEHAKSTANFSIKCIEI